MRTVDDASRSRRRALVLWTAIAAASALLGAAVAWALQPGDPLSAADPRRTPIERHPTVLGQWILAVQDNTEQAWRAIEQHYPQETYYVHRARQQLARRYLHEDRLAEARELFTQFARLESTQAELRAFGLAGLAIVYSLEGDPQQSQRKIAELLPLREHLEDPELGTLVLRTARTNRQKLAQADKDTAEKWLEEKFGEDFE